MNKGQVLERPVKDAGLTLLVSIVMVVVILLNTVKYASRIVFILLSYSYFIVHVRDITCTKTSFVYFFSEEISVPKGSLFVCKPHTIVQRATVSP